MNVQHIDSVLVFHKQADAIGGLDDFCDMQRMQVDDAASGVAAFFTMSTSTSGS